MHYPAMLMASWLAGLIPGLLSTVMCSAYTLLILRPHLLMAPQSDWPGAIRIGMLFTTGVLFTLLIAALQQALNEADRAIALRDEFISLASHELKTPLASLKLQSQALKKVLSFAGGDSPMLTRLFRLSEGAERSILRLERLVSNMLDVPILRLGKELLSPAPCDLSELAASVMTAFQVQAAEAGCDLSLEAPEPVYGIWDQSRIEQVMVNLLSNAIKYGRGSPIRMHVSYDHNFAQFEVVDQGIGIAKSDQKRIFQRFERAVEYSQVQGLGLGLYLSLRIVELHDGMVSLESELGQGARFKVRLPLADSSGKQIRIG